jgi:hypothetical protein
VTGRLLRRRDLHPGQEAAMLDLLRAQFTSVSDARFRRDLDDKTWVVLLCDEGGEVRGFSTLDCYETRFRGGPVTVVYSGDTVVDPGAAGSSALSRSWIGAVQLLRRLHPHGPLYWLLIVSGYRTYRFLPVYWKHFLPRFDAPDSPESRALRDALAAERFGPLYDHERGIVRFPEPQVLRPPLCGIPGPRLADPHVAFFAERNPGHARGDELVCLTELSRDNLTPAGLRMWTAGEPLFAAERMPA